MPISRTTLGVADLLSAADNACYLAKEHGRNRVHVCSSDDVQLAGRRQEAHWITRINKALEEDLFSLVLHPVIPLNDRFSSREEPGRQSVELQLQMRDDQGSEIPATVFMPAAERYHMAQELDLWALEHALHWLAGDPERVRTLSHCCIDLTVASLRDGDFVDAAVVVLKDSGVPAKRICFGLPEATLLDGNSASSRFIDCLREIGAHFAVNGFGTGQATVRTIGQLPVDSLKLHPDVVNDVLDNPAARILAKNLVEIARITGKQSVAPWIRSKATLGVLRDIGMDFAVCPAVGIPRAIEIPRKRA